MRVCFLGTRNGVGVSTLAAGLLASNRALGLESRYGSIARDFIEHIRVARLGSAKDTILPSPLDGLEPFGSAFSRFTAGEGFCLLDCGAVSTLTQTPEIFEILDSSIVIVLDANTDLQDGGEALSGALQFLKRHSKVGLIANYVSDQQHSDAVAAFAEGEPGVDLLGLVPSFLTNKFGSNKQLDLTRSEIRFCQSLIERHVDIKKTFLLAASSSSKRHFENKEDGFSVAVAVDSLFGIGPRDNLRLLESRGARIDEFSPALSARLPSDCKLLYLSGIRSLSAICKNSFSELLLHDITVAISEGLPVYLEGMSCAYAFQRLSVDGENFFPGLGLIEGTFNCEADVSSTSDLFERLGELNGHPSVICDLDSSYWSHDSSQLDSIIEKALRYDKVPNNRAE